MVDREKVQEKDVRMFFEIPESLRRALKITAAEQGRTSKSIIVNILKDYLKTVGKKKDE